MATYKMFDSKGNEVNHPDLQHKALWCKAGESIEAAFVREHGERLGYGINPEKVKDRFSPDLLNFKTGLRADLKTQNTPFFTAQRKYGIDPTYAVVFNLKDMERYQEKYPEIEIVFWVDWVAVKYQTPYGATECSPLTGIWSISFEALSEILKVSPLHEYQQRTNDNRGNARSSFVLDIRNIGFNRLS